MYDYPVFKKHVQVMPTICRFWLQPNTIEVTIKVILSIDNLGLYEIVWIMLTLYSIR
jgi:hypothetical protein